LPWRVTFSTGTGFRVPLRPALALAIDHIR
jgi:hypothetical protein